MKFRELHQRRGLLEKLLRDARELSEGSPERKLAVPAILQAITYEKRGQHDECDRTLRGLQTILRGPAKTTTQNREPDAAPESENAAKTDGTRRAKSVR